MNNNAPIAAIQAMADYLYHCGVLLVSGDDEEIAPLAAAIKRVDEWLQLRRATNPAKFSAEVCFTNIDAASEGIRILAAAGFAAEVSDVNEGGIFVAVTRSAAQADLIALGQQVVELIDKFGDVIEFEIGHA